jgi:hypothetical protein
MPKLNAHLGYLSNIFRPFFCHAGEWRAENTMGGADANTSRKTASWPGWNVSGGITEMERGRPARNHVAGETPALHCSFTLTVMALAATPGG